MAFNAVFDILSVTSVSFYDFLKSLLPVLRAIFLPLAIFPHSHRRKNEGREINLVGMTIISSRNREYVYSVAVY